jgi:drug/metabolite transporter (DMT)-like permease
MLRTRFGRHELALVGITMIWGTTFLIIHIAMRHSGPLFFVGLRFCTAGLITLLVFPRALRGTTRRDLAAGVAIGATLFLGYGLQTFGLVTVSSSMSAFITALYVPMVPLFEWLLLRRRPKPAGLLGMVFAFTGLVLISGPQAAGFSFGLGEWATLGAAVAAAAEIVLIGHYAGNNVDLRRVTVIQLLTAGVLALLAMPATGEHLPSFSWLWLFPALGLGAASCLIQLTMNWAQKSVPATRATLIYSGEPVWGGVVGRLAGDRLPALSLFGAALIVAGVVVSELKWVPRRERSGDHHSGEGTYMHALESPPFVTNEELGGAGATAAAPAAPGLADVAVDAP